MEHQKTGDSNVINRAYMDSLLLKMRLIGSDLPSTEYTLFGETFASPVMTAALSHLHNHRPNGMVELAKGARDANLVLWVGMGDNAELDEIVATGARTIKIVKPYSDEGMIFDQISHAEQAGCLAVGMDIDHAFNKNGGYDAVFGTPMRPKTLNQIKSYVRATKLPFIIKGVLSEEDAAKCLEAGVAGIVVSHHHGIMDYAVPPLQILPAIARVVAKRVPIFVDCGLASGMDVFKALALGADAASLGRSLMGPLTEGGAEAVTAAMQTATRELAHAMAMTGSRDLAHIDPGVLVTAGR
jgi:isopentenyl diphosphate isomerase/L-lactate dehydrogenase-like FMN-dependent dehydrogenase